MNLSSIIQYVGTIKMFGWKILAKVNAEKRDGIHFFRVIRKTTYLKQGYK